MVKQANYLTSEIDKLNDKEASAVLDFITELLSTRKSNSNETFFYDELITSLSDKHENRRAVQVFEWEKVRRGEQRQRV
jgi:hypothetical protein